VTEPELRAAITALADELHIRWLYFGSDTRRQQGQWRGFPDLLLCGGHAHMYAELKAAGKQPRADQKSWHHALAAAGARIAVWQPRHWHDGTIAAELAALNLPKGQAAAAVVSDEPDPETAFFRALYGPRR
jgi:hypothetical protein